MATRRLEDRTSLRRPVAATRTSEFLAYDESYIADPYTVAPVATTTGYQPSMGRAHGRREFSTQGVMYEKPVREKTQLGLPKGAPRCTHVERAPVLPVGASHAFYSGKHPEPSLETEDSAAYKSKWEWDGNYSSRAEPDKTRKLANRYQDNEEFLEDLKVLRQEKLKYASYSKEAEQERLRRQSIVREEQRRDRALLENWEKFDPFGRQGAGAPLERKRHVVPSSQHLDASLERQAPPSEFHAQFGRAAARPNDTTGTYGRAPLITQEHQVLRRRPDSYHDQIFGQECVGGLPRREGSTIVAKKTNMLARGKHFEPQRAHVDDQRLPKENGFTVQATGDRSSGSGRRSSYSRYGV